MVDSRSALHVVDVDTGESRFLEAMTDEFGGVKLAVAADGRYVAVIWRPRFPNPDTGEDNYTLVTVWDVVTGERRFDPQRLPYAAASVAINGGGWPFVTVSGGYDGRTQVRSGTTGELVVEIDPLPRPPEADFGVSTVAVAFDPDGDLIVGSMAGPNSHRRPANSAAIWTASTRRRIRRIGGSSSATRATRSSPSERRTVGATVRVSP